MPLHLEMAVGIFLVPATILSVRNMYSEDSLGVAELVGSVESSVSKYYTEKKLFKPVRYYKQGGLTLLAPCCTRFVFSMM